MFLLSFDDFCIICRFISSSGSRQHDEW